MPDAQRPALHAPKCFTFAAARSLACSAQCQARNDALYTQGVGRQYHEPAETLWAWLGQLGTITQVMRWRWRLRLRSINLQPSTIPPLQYMTHRNRWGRIERGLQLWNERQADRIVPLLCSMQVSAEQAQGAAQAAVTNTLGMLERHYNITADQVGAKSVCY